MAYLPMKTPVFSWLVPVLSISDLWETFSIYSLTSFSQSLVTNFLTNGCSGAKQTYVHPNKVSARVVKTENLSLLSATSKSISVP